MTDVTDIKRIAVIGGGASGLVAAITAKRCKSNVTVFEKLEKPGSKIMKTGNGKCNLTNSSMGTEFFRGEDPDFVKYALDHFGVSETLSFFENIGVAPKCRNGYYYPNSEEASSVSDCLVLECIALGVRFCYEEVTDIEKNGRLFIVSGRQFDRVIICCGSYAGLRDISSFKGYNLCEKLGHHLTPLYPALTQIMCEGKFFRTLKGVRSEAEISIISDGMKFTTERGEILFTDHGISGIPSFQVSRFCNSLLAEDSEVYVSIDLFPNLSEEELMSKLSLCPKNSRRAEEALYGILNHKLNYVILQKIGADPVGRAESVLTDKNLRAYAVCSKKFKCRVTGTNGFEFSQVVAGGVKTNEIDPNTMGSKKVPGLFFAGEIVDIDGTCGGYNLQWAWSSGHLAGESASK